MRRPYGRAIGVLSCGRVLFLARSLCVGGREGGGGNIEAFVRTCVRLRAWGQ